MRSSSARRDADAVVGDGDLDVVVVAARLDVGGDDHPGTRVGVDDGVLDQVADRDAELAGVAEHAAALGAGDGQGDLVLLGVHPAAVDRVDQHLVDRRPPPASASGSSACSRDSSMIWATRSVSRADSIPIRPANRRTAGGSSAASSTASASSEIAPIGVLSSWLTLATKSRRVCSIRRAAVWSSARIRTCSSGSGATRAVRWVGAARSAADSRSWIRISAVAADLRGPGRAAARSATRLPRTRPRVRAAVVGLQHLVVRADDDPGGRQHVQHLGDALGQHRRRRRRRRSRSRSGRRAPEQPPRHEHAEQDAQQPREHQREPGSGSQQR